jgi:ribosome-associated toxin RatA of RatAB toxin-antitoxin module
MPRVSAREPVRKVHFIAAATPAEVYAVVVDFPSYPRLFPEIQEARVLSTTAEETGQVWRVEFRAQAVLPVRYVLDLTCNPKEPSVDWRFVEGEVVTDSTGGWRFAAERGGTSVDYRVSMDIKAPLPGFVLRKITDGLVGASLPKMFSAIEDEVRRRRAAAARS